MSRFPASYADAVRDYREFDCRDASKKLERRMGRAGVQALIDEGRLDSAVFARGRELSMVKK